MVVRIWKGKKEMVDSYYFSGQVWDIKRQLWVTVTDRFNTEDEARMALEKVKLNPSKKQVMTQTIEQLQAKVAELEAENARLRTVPMKYRRMAFNAQLQDENKELCTHLAAAARAIASSKGEQ